MEQVQEVTAIEVTGEKAPSLSITELLSKGMEYARGKLKEAEEMPDDADGTSPYNTKSKKYKTEYWKTRENALLSEFEIFRNLWRISNSYIYIGKLLSEIQEKRLYFRALTHNAQYTSESLGYSYISFEDYCKAKFNLKKSSAYALIDVYKIFGTCDGKLKENYKAYNYSQLAEMCSLPEAKRKDVTPEMTVKEIRELKKSLSPKKSDTEAVTEMKIKPERQDTVTVEAQAIPEDSGNVRLLFKNKAEREKWVKDYRQHAYLWVDVPALKQRVFRYDFLNGISLIFTEWGSTYEKQTEYTSPSLQLMRTRGDSRSTVGTGYNISDYYGFGGLTLFQVVDFMTKFKDEI